MQRNFGIILNYMQDDILVSQDEIKDCNKKIFDMEFLYSLIEERNVDLSNYGDIFSQLYISFDKMKESLFILSKYEHSSIKDEAQVVSSLRFVNAFLSKLKNIIVDENRKLDDLKKKYINKKRNYYNYLNIFDSYGLRKDITMDDVDPFINYLRLTKIDPAIVDEFEIYCINNLVVNKEKASEDSSFFHSVEVDKIADKEDDKTKNIEWLSNDKLEKTQKLIEEFENLSDEEKNVIISAKSIADEGNSEYLKDFSRDFTVNELLYFVEIVQLKSLYDNYCAKSKVEDLELEDKDLLLVLKEEIQELNEKINASLQKVEKYSTLINEQNVQLDELLQSNNLLLFLDANEYLDECIEPREYLKNDIEKINEKVGGEVDKALKMIVRVMNTQLLSMTANELHSLSASQNKRLFEAHNETLPYFKEFNVRVCKGRLHNPARITYLTIPLSENNRKELIEKYYLRPQAYVYLVIGMFVKNNKDDRYTDITHNRIMHEYKNILKLQQIFSVDFTDETRNIAFKLIDESKKMLDNLKKEYLNEGELML